MSDARTVVRAHGFPWRGLGAATLLAFALHFVWEVIQCRLFFIHLELPPTWGAMLFATVGDVAMTLFAYCVVAVGARDARWFLRRPWRLSAVTLLELSAAVLAVAVERMGLDMGRWSYRAGAPMLPMVGISLIPVAQLMLLFPATFGGGRAFR